MAAFKHHCSFGFWLGAVMNDTNKVLQVEQKNGMGDFGQIRSIENLPAEKIILDLIWQAMRLTDEGVKLPRKEKVQEVPDPHPDFIKALDGQKSAQEHFNNFSPSHKKEYIEWINDAKTALTRQKRIADAVLWLHEGKVRNWKYQNC